ncbi:hypothetical protein FIBSPDRAFT_292798 [Athelia psychrophila]|uniref:Uncharacterized protein n=1 Tax=Athelia psychrophila TaxID=1759441 RepID=A0A166R1J9_9AGAM|nr:hypothetical protein FIBSPDRAFT_292798 [Fibularhizoctonia sp. CBS 109695]
MALLNLQFLSRPGANFYSQNLSPARIAYLMPAARFLPVAPKSGAAFSPRAMRPFSDERIRNEDGRQLSIHIPCSGSLLVHCRFLSFRKLPVRSGASRELLSGIFMAASDLEGGISGKISSFRHKLCYKYISRTIHVAAVLSNGSYGLACPFMYLAPAHQLHHCRYREGLLQKWRHAKGPIRGHI